MYHFSFGCSKPRTGTFRESGGISKFDYSDWAAPTVYVKKKNEKIQLFADFSNRLNDYLKDHIYLLPSPEDIFKLNGVKVFSKIDLSEAYLQVKVDEKYSKLFVINTHKGLCKLNCLPFGLKVAPILLQQVMDTILAGLEFATQYLDDILLRIENNEQHKKHIKGVFQEIDVYGFKLSSDKCDFFMKQIKYLTRIVEDRTWKGPKLLKYATTKQCH